MSEVTQIIELEPGSGAWWDLVHAVREAEKTMSKLSISRDVNCRGAQMIAVKIGESMWSSHRTGVKS